jgi:hypothetical protein
MSTDTVQDVMQVCESGHVITDLLLTHPELGLTHCDRCGAATLAHCLTCGAPLPGAIPVPGLEPIGERQPPQHCPNCGASFPWTERPGRPLGAGPLAQLEMLLRRLPLVARQLRSRHGDRPAFLVRDEHDLEDLVRALLPLHFDDIRPEGRTPSYAPSTRSDFLLAPEGIAVTSKCTSTSLREPQLAAQAQEDAGYYQGRQDCRILVMFVYDPEQLLREPRRLETAWLRAGSEPELRWVVAG